MRSRIARNGFKDIARALRDRICAGDIIVGHYLPTERELQEQYGASRSTVRRALAMLVEEGWAQSVPSKGVIAATGVVRSRSDKIALVDGSTYVLRVMLVRIGTLLRERGYHLVHVGGSNHASMEDQLEYASNGEFAGAFIWPFRGFPEASAMQNAVRSLPVVTLDHKVRGLDSDFVTFDYFGAATLATEHLIRQGCQRIAVTGMIDMLSVTHDRFSGYMNAMFKHDLQPQPSDFIFTSTSGLAAPDPTPLLERLKQPNRPDGLFVFQDEFVPLTIETVLRAGLRVPRDVKIVAIGDDVDVDVDGAGMTAVVLDWDAMAEEAVQLLVERMESPLRPPQTRLANHRLVVRGLCGANEEDWTAGESAITGFHGELPYPRSRYRFTSSMVSRSAVLQ